MRLRIVLLLLAAMVAGSVTALALPEKGEDEREDNIAFKDAPQAIQAAIRKVTTVEEITELERITDDGLTVYEVEFKKDGRGEWISYYEYTSSEGDNYSEEYGYSLDWEKGAKRSFDIEIDDIDLDMNCTIDGDDMVCEGDVDGEDVTMDLERIDEE